MSRRSTALRLALLAVFAACTGLPRASAQSPPALRVEPGTGDAVVVSWPAAATGYRLEEAASLEGSPAWQPSSSVPVAAGDHWTVTLSPAGTSRYFRLRASAPRPLTTIVETSPANGADGVSVTRETVFRLSAPLAPEAVADPGRLSARFGGRRLLTRGEISSERDRLSLFYLEDLPPGSRIEVTLDGNGLKDGTGSDVDVDGDGQPGGVRQLFFDTFSAAPVPRTAVVGRIYASDPAPGAEPGTFTNRPLAGVIITVDGAEETLRTVTDATGGFRLEPAP
ncbi:MAG: Ig-like domain-containing protein, partial [Verrucomicrobiota bacterium]